MAFILMQSFTGVKRRSPTEKKFLDRTKNDLTDMNTKNVKIRRRECITTIPFEKQKFTWGEKVLMQHPMITFQGRLDLVYQLFSEQ